MLVIIFTLEANVCVLDFFFPSNYLLRKLENADNYISIIVNNTKLIL